MNDSSPEKILMKEMNKLNIDSEGKEIPNLSSQDFPLNQTISFNYDFLSNSAPKTFNFEFSNQIPQKQQDIPQQFDFGCTPIMTSQITMPFMQQKINSSTLNSTQTHNQETKNFLKKIAQDDDETLPVLSVILTMYSGSSYDDLFRSVKQVAPAGRVSLYTTNLESTDLLLLALQGKLNEIKNEEFKLAAEELLKDIDSVEPDCVLFNWECCSSCGASFPQKENTMLLLKLLIEKKFMTMFSDFALKSLIKDWSVELLGMNPFVKIGKCNSFINLKFKPEVLKECPSSQLKMVGQLCEKGEASLHALSSTIVFTVDNSKIDGSRYQLDILTIVTGKGGYCNLDSERNLHGINGSKGSVGHAIIKYHNGGYMIVSAGHWVELSKLDVNTIHLEKVAENFGGEYSKQFNIIKNSNQSESEKFIQYNQIANQMVMQSAPCNYSKKNQQCSKK